MTDIGIDLKKKNDSVNLQLDPAFKGAAPILKTAWIMYGSECVVTCGRDDRGHSENSAHYRGQAVDLRITNLVSLYPTGIPKFAQRLSKALVDCLGPYWWVVLEPDPKGPHIHLEYSKPNERPNIAAYQVGVHYYQKAVG